MLLWPPEFHLDRHSYTMPKKQSTMKNKACTLINISDLSQPHNTSSKENPHDYRFSLMNTSIQKNISIHNESNQNLNSSKKTKSKKESSKMFLSKERQKENTPIYLITVNNKNQLIYTWLYSDSKKIDEDMIGTIETVFQFEEIITTIIHIDNHDIILFCGSPNLFFWNVPEKKLLYKHKISIPVEPWFLIWDAIFIKSKQTLILSLNNGFVLQLNFDVKSLFLTDMKVFQSNEKGHAVYNMSYFPSVDKILATNNDNLLTEFSFQLPKSTIKKGLMMGSSKNIDFFSKDTPCQMKTRSIRDISLFENPNTMKLLNSRSNHKNK